MMADWKCILVSFDSTCRIEQRFKNVDMFCQVCGSASPFEIFIVNESQVKIHKLRKEFDMTMKSCGLSSSATFRVDRSCVVNWWWKKSTKRARMKIPKKTCSASAESFKKRNFWCNWCPKPCGAHGQNYKCWATKKFFDETFHRSSQEMQVASF